MATVSQSKPFDDPQDRRRLTPQSALRYAWYGWLALLAFPFLLFIVVFWRLVLDGATPRRTDAIGHTWFVAMALYHVLVVPGSIFLRGRIFRNYYRGQCLSPPGYLLGMFIVWLTLELGGLLSLTGCLVSGSLLPNLFPALVALMIFVTLWPSGRAMTCEHRGDSDDPENYEEPR